MSKYFDIIPTYELRQMQKKSAKKKVANYNIRCEAALHVFENYGDIKMVMDAFGVSRANAYFMVQRGKELLK